jgi:hypothetical protein
MSALPLPGSAISARRPSIIRTNPADRDGSAGVRRPFRQVVEHGLSGSGFEPHWHGERPRWRLLLTCIAVLMLFPKLFSHPRPKIKRAVDCLHGLHAHFERHEAGPVKFGTSSVDDFTVKSKRRGLWVVSQFEIGGPF